ncbi:TPA: hypothetical protein RZJ77_001575 [Campylobacter coli]|nr:hypothetical protein [Campylobacter coli]
MKRDFAIIIPAQESNQYHEKGDLAPFGDTTLLQWKISQCKEFCSNTQIFIASNSESIKRISEEENTSFLPRGTDMIKYSEMITRLSKRIDVENIILTHCSAPFIDSKIYRQMYTYFIQHGISFLTGGKTLQEYVVYNNKKLNFETNFSDRSQIDRISLITHGCYIFNREMALRNNAILKEKFEIFELDDFSSIEVKNFNEYIIARELIGIYFQKRLKE